MYYIVVGPDAPQLTEPWAPCPVQQDVVIRHSQWSGLSAPPKQLTTSIIDGYQGQEITWERIVLDLHSGRIAGDIGVLIMDLAALFLGYLALSGAWLYWRRRG